jgi:type II secretory pathway component PulC
MWIINLILKKYPWVVFAPIVGGIILVGASTANTMYRAFRYTPPSISSDKVVTTDSPESRPTLDHYAVIYQRDLFTSALQTKEEKAEADLTKTSAPTVPFKLKGTVVVSPGVSCAIIEDTATREEELYHQDETVQGFKIVKILRNKVIVDKDGREEVVEVVEEEEKTPVRPSQRPTTERKTPIRRPVRKVPPGTEVPLDLQ